MTVRIPRSRYARYARIRVSGIVYTPNDIKYPIRVRVDPAHVAYYNVKVTLRLPFVRKRVDSRKVANSCNNSFPTEAIPPHG